MKMTRKFFGMSQGQIGRYVKVNRSYIGQVERGERSASSNLYMQLQHLVYLEGKFADIETPDPSQPQDPDQVQELLKGYRRDLKRVNRDLNNTKANRKKLLEKLRAHRMKALLVESLLLLGENEKALARDLQVDLRRDNKALLEAELYRANARIPSLEREAANLAQHIAHLEKIAEDLKAEREVPVKTVLQEEESKTATVGNREVNVAFMKACIAIGQWFAGKARYERVLKAHGGRKKKSAYIMARHLLGEPVPPDPQLWKDHQQICREMEEAQKNFQKPGEIPPDSLVQPEEKMPLGEVTLGRVA